MTPIFVSGFETEAYLRGDIHDLSKHMVDKDISNSFFQKISVSYSNKMTQSSSYLKDIVGNKFLELKKTEYNKIIEEEKNKFKKEIKDIVDQKGHLDGDLFYAMESFQFDENLKIFPVNFGDVFRNPSQDKFFQEVVSRLLGSQVYRKDNLLSNILNNKVLKKDLKKISYYFPEIYNWFDFDGYQGILDSGFSYYFWDSEQVFLSWLDHQAVKEVIFEPVMDSKDIKNTLEMTILSTNDVCCCCRGTLSILLGKKWIQKKIMEIIKKDNNFEFKNEEIDFSLFCVSKRIYSDKYLKEMEKDDA